MCAYISSLIDCWKRDISVLLEPSMVCNCFNQWGYWLRRVWCVHLTHFWSQPRCCNSSNRITYIWRGRRTPLTAQRHSDNTLNTLRSTLRTGMFQLPENITFRLRDPGYRFPSMGKWCEFSERKNFPPMNTNIVTELELEPQSVSILSQSL